MVTKRRVAKDKTTNCLYREGGASTGCKPCGNDYTAGGGGADDNKTVPLIMSPEEVHLLRTAYLLLYDCALGED